MNSGCWHSYEEGIFREQRQTFKVNLALDPSQNMNYHHFNSLTTTLLQQNFDPTIKYLGSKVGSYVRSNFKW